MSKFLHVRFPMSVCLRVSLFPNLYVSMFHLIYKHTCILIWTHPCVMSPYTYTYTFKTSSLHPQIPMFLTPSYFPHIGVSIHPYIGICTFLCLNPPISFHPGLTQPDTYMPQVIPGHIPHAQSWVPTSVPMTIPPLHSHIRLPTPS